MSLEGPRARVSLEAEGLLGGLRLGEAACARRACHTPDLAGPLSTTTRAFSSLQTCGFRHHEVGARRVGPRSLPALQARWGVLPHTSHADSADPSRAEREEPARLAYPAPLRAPLPSG